MLSALFGAGGEQDTAHVPFKVKKQPKSKTPKKPKKNAEPKPTPIQSSGAARFVPVPKPESVDAVDASAMETSLLCDDVFGEEDAASSPVTTSLCSDMVPDIAGDVAEESSDEEDDLPLFRERPKRERELYTGPALYRVDDSFIF